MRVHNKLESLVYNAIDLNKEWQNKLKDCSLKGATGIVNYAKEYQTVKIDVGRQIGKTSLIARSVNINDVVITYNQESASHLLKKISSFNIFGVSVFNASCLPECDRNFDTVWIDESKCIKEVDIERIYEIFAGKCKQFVFIG